MTPKQTAAMDRILELRANSKRIREARQKSLAGDRIPVNKIPKRRLQFNISIRRFERLKNPDIGFNSKTQLTYKILEREVEEEQFFFTLKRFPVPMRDVEAAFDDMKKRTVDLMRRRGLII